METTPSVGVVIPLLFQERSSLAILAPMRRLSPVFILLLVLGCGALREDLGRAEQCYHEARYQDATTYLVSLQEHVPDMDQPERAKYFYLRGMTSYRLGDRDDALHYLALAREEAGGAQGLDAQERKQMQHALAELTPQDASFHARKSAAEGQ